MAKMVSQGYGHGKNVFRAFRVEKSTTQFSVLNDSCNKVVALMHELGASIFVVYIYELVYRRKLDHILSHEPLSRHL